MSIIQTANVLQFLAAIGTFSFVAFYVATNVRIDCYRQHLFAVRNELFDYAAAGNISLLDPAYTLLRDQMNALIRYGHNITLFRIFMGVAVRSAIGHQVPQNDWHERWEKSVSKIHDPQVRIRIRRFHHRAELAAVKRLVTGSLLLLVVVGIAMMVEALKHGWRNYRKVKQVACDKVLVGPLDPRQIEEEAMMCATA